MTTPPLQPIKNLRRVLRPEEGVVYTARLHPLHGWPYLLGALFFLWLGLRIKLFLLVAAGLAWVYALPFWHFEMAITTQRLLLRRGRFTVQMETMEGHEIEEWQVRQTMLQTLVHAGTLWLRLAPEDGKPQRLHLLCLWHPVTVVEALEALLHATKKAPKA